jgi:alkane 1-monooxygenase
MIFSREKCAWYWLSTSIPALATVSFCYGRPWLFLFVLIAAILIGDSILGEDFNAAGRPEPQASVGVGVPLAFVTWWEVAALIACERAVRARPLEFVGLTVASGVLSAFAMAHIHEVMHRPNRLSRVVSDLALAWAGYPHYRVVHLLHHAHVGNPRYGSTAHAGLSLWRHVSRSFWGALVVGFENEFVYIHKRRRSRLLIPVLTCAAMTMLIAWKGGRYGIVFYLGQSAISVFIVEAIGYIQHYGLSESDRPESQIAWDVPWWLSNRLFANNGRHTHHHLEQTQRFDQLGCVGEPLPAGYLHMFFLALLPPLWFSVMDRRLPKKIASTVVPRRQG